MFVKIFGIALHVNLRSEKTPPGSVKKMAATKKKHKTSFLISILACSRFPHSFLTTQLLPDSIWTTRKADTVAELDQRLTENTL